MTAQRVRFATFALLVAGSVAALTYRDQLDLDAGAVLGVAPQEHARRLFQDESGAPWRR